MSKFHIVLGTGFGDEGKGVFVDYLANLYSNLLPIVIRHNGGHQAGHTVKMRDGRSHVFSNFGSGSFRNVPTFISKYCTIDPVGIVNEYKALTDIKVDPTLYVDAMAMVTTPYDKMYNQVFSKARNNGTVGVGFGATIERNEGPCKLYAMDLNYPTVVELKLNAIKNYYLLKTGMTGLHKSQLPKEMQIDHAAFISACNEALNIFEIEKEHDIMSGNRTVIFEGAQGILLDQDHGFFPNVTRSHTTSRNAMEMIKRYHPEDPYLFTTIYYLTRAYATRHGNGPFPQEQNQVELINNDEETNVHGEYQGEFRTGMFDVDMLTYAMECDWNYSYLCREKLVISCLDQLIEYKLTSCGEVHEYSREGAFIESIVSGTSIDQVYRNRSPYSDTITTRG